MNSARLQVVLSTLAFSVVIALSFYLFSQEKIVAAKLESASLSEQFNQDEVILYYAYGCPHCEVVDAYLADNQIQNKIRFEKKEISSDINNVLDLQGKAKVCGLRDDAVGVPFLWDGKRCLVGDKDIIAFFAKRTEIK